MDHDLEQQCLALLSLYWFQFARFEVWSFVRVKFKKAESAELDLVQGDLGCKCLAALGDKSVELDFAGNFELVSQKLDFFQENNITELDDYLLGEGTEFRTMPSFGFCV